MLKICKWEPSYTYVSVLVAFCVLITFFDYPFTLIYIFFLYSTAYLLNPQEQKKMFFIYQNFIAIVMMSVIIMWWWWWLVMTFLMCFFSCNRSLFSKRMASNTSFMWFCPKKVMYMKEIRWNPRNVSIHIKYLSYTFVPFFVC